MVKPRRIQREAGAGLWERPEALTALADTLTFAALLLLAYAAVMSVAHMSALPVKTVEVTTPLNEVGRAQLEAAARTSLRGNMLTVDLEALRTALEAVPWVRRADLRRQWPDAVEARIEEHVPAANWRQAGGGQDSRALVNTFGEVFGAEPRAGLPQLSGPLGSSRAVLERYAEVSRVLATAARKPVAVSLSQRLAWQVTLNDGLVLELGRDQEPGSGGAPVENTGSNRNTAERLERFARIYPHLFKSTQAEVADLRYANGFALRNVKERRETDTKGLKG